MNDFDAIDILLVEDNEFDAELTLRALRKGGVTERVYWVKDGEEAMAFMQCTGAYAERNAQHAPKLVLLDLKMPKMDGFDVLRAFKAESATRDVPVVAVTSSNQRRDVEESYRLGINGYIAKPVAFDDFVEALRVAGTYWLHVNLTATHV